MTERPLWTPRPQDVAASGINAFMAEVNRRHRLALSSYRDLHAWSVDHSDQFWGLLWDTCGVIGQKGNRLVADAGEIPGARFLPDARLSFAENILRRSDDGEAIVFRGEDKAAARFTWRDLSALVSRLQQALKESGVGVGDRVAWGVAGCECPGPIVVKSLVDGWVRRIGASDHFGNFDPTLSPDGSRVAFVRSACSPRGRCARPACGSGARSSSSSR